MEEEGFFARWSRRKGEVRVEEAVVVQHPHPDPLPQAGEGALQEAAAAEAAPPPPPTLEDTFTLTPASDFTRFIAPDVAPEVKSAALKKLFADPHFNVMDGLDTYIDDYNKPDPLPDDWLRKMVQSQLLGLFTDDPADPAPTPSEPTAPPAADENPDLQLQPVDDAGRAGPEPRAGEDPAGQP